MKMDVERLQAESLKQAMRWQEHFNADGTPKPLRDPRDTTLWPNTTSHANSDEWIVKNHDRIRQMRPRLLCINFVNGIEPGKPERIFADLLTAVNEGSRYHGYKDPSAPRFLEYSVWRYVDLGDPAGPKGKNSRFTPRKKVKPANGLNGSYDGFFTDEFAALIGVKDPKNNKRFLTLKELVDQGWVHEVWFNGAADGEVGWLECVEIKPVYDEQFRRVPGQHRQAGNGGDDEQRFIGRSLRLNMLNFERGIGCGMENLGHSMEGMAHSGCIPYFKKYFYEFGMFDLDKRFPELGFNSFYPLWGEGKGIDYPDESTAIVKNGEKQWTLKEYYATGGNVHFTPNGRSHYDLVNPQPVLSTIEDWRIGSGPGGKDVKKLWSIDTLKPYETLAPDCMGRWLVYWRQNIPGYKNKSKDDQGKPMKNWWPFLFY
ncbi:MAG: hypothetical protein KIT45_06940 [Fimbriimonadia bacterium]|nr:hypothetical protein [Fimbriimonadia bacterium]